MAKPLICDRCGQVKPEDRFMKSRIINIGNIKTEDNYTLKIEFLKDGEPGDICINCMEKLIIEAGKELSRPIKSTERILEEKSKA